MGKIFTSESTRRDFSYISFVLCMLCLLLSCRQPFRGSSVPPRRSSAARCPLWRIYSALAASIEDPSHPGHHLQSSAKRYRSIKSQTNTALTQTVWDIWLLALQHFHLENSAQMSTFQLQLCMYMLHYLYGPQFNKCSISRSTISQLKRFFFHRLQQIYVFYLYTYHL